MVQELPLARRRLTGAGISERGFRASRLGRRGRPHPPAPSPAAAGEGEQQNREEPSPPPDPRIAAARRHSSRYFPLSAAAAGEGERAKQSQGRFWPAPGSHLPWRGHFLIDTYPCQITMGEGENIARGRPWPSPGPHFAAARPTSNGCLPRSGGLTRGRIHREAAAPRQNGVRGRAWPSPEAVAHPPRRRGRGGWGVRAAPVDSVARRGTRHRLDTSPCQAAGEGAGDEGGPGGPGREMRTPLSFGNLPLSVPVGRGPRRGR